MANLPDDLSKQPGAFRARSLPVTVVVRFATANGVVETLEGAVAYTAGDALLTGITGENWPVTRARFLESYMPLLGTEVGSNGRYVKNPREVWAWRADREINVVLPGGIGSLNAHPGDIVVQYALSDCAVVQPDIFSATYAPVGLSE
ncbi:MAG: hypothetical protein PF483_11615 [Halothiobacillus sp.]|jgi:hypothetical protein|nr:hypothetical protein [Halothiobacillus sp.]